MGGEMVKNKMKDLKYQNVALVGMGSFLSLRHMNEGKERGRSFVGSSGYTEKGGLNCYLKHLQSLSINHESYSSFNFRFVLHDVTRMFEGYHFLK